jgi:hypothetical protein
MVGLSDIQWGFSSLDGGREKGKHARRWDSGAFGLLATTLSTHIMR